MGIHSWGLSGGGATLAPLCPMSCIFIEFWAKKLPNNKLAHRIYGIGAPGISYPGFTTHSNPSASVFLKITLML